MTVCTAHDFCISVKLRVAICSFYSLYFLVIFNICVFTKNLVEFRYLSTEEGGEYLDLKRRKCLKNEEHL